MDAQLKIRLPKDLKDQADLLAREQMMTLSTFARLALNESVKRVEQTRKLEDAGREAAKEQ